MHKSFSSCFVHAKSHRVCGLKLQPFCAGHWFFLEAIESPLVVGGEVGGVDLLLAANLCRQKVSKNTNFLPLVKKPSLSSIFFLSKNGLDAEIENWSAYIRETAGGPARLQMEGPGKKSSAPSPLSLVANALSMGIPEDRAWTMPISFLRAYSDVSAEINGAKIAFELDDREELATIAAIKEAEAIGKKMMEELRRV